jgi:hypothetical protein
MTNKAGYPRLSTGAQLGWAGLFLLVLGLVGVPGLHVKLALSAGAVRGYALAFTLSGILLWFLALGQSITGKFWGVALSGRNTYSLSRLQMAGWTWLVLSALAAAAICNLWGIGGTEIEKSLDITIDENLLLVMGIAFGSGVAAPGVLSLKAQGPDATDDEMQGAQQRMGDAAIQSQGRIIARTNRQDAVLSDFVKGDEVSNAGLVDLSKVQQLLITILLWASFAALTFREFVGSTGAITALPHLGERMVWFLGLSHAGYIAYKAVPKPAGVGATDTQAIASVVPPVSLALAPSRTGMPPPP